MKHQLTETELEQRKKTNTKILKYLGIGAVLIFGLPLIISLFIDEDKITKDIDKAAGEKAKMQLDSIINLIKTDQTIKTTKVEYRIDSVLEIHIPPKDDKVYAMAFDNLYKIMDIGNVSEIEVFQKGTLISTVGHKTQLKLDEFKSKFVSSYDGSCKPLNDYIKQQMNDPSSFEHDRTFITPLLNGNYQVKTIFRGKNAFGGVVLNSVFAEITPSGQILSVENDL